jgi:hypothetical protein
VASFSNKDIIDDIIANDGEADPMDGSRFDVVKIVNYTTPEGDSNNWGVVYRCEVPLGMLDRYENASHCINPKVIFVRKAP